MRILFFGILSLFGRPMDCRGAEHQAFDNDRFEPGFDQQVG
jgi:hypothetical protein